MQMPFDPIRDAASGAIATLPMSVVMVVGARMGHMGEQPPTIISTHALREIGVADHTDHGPRLAPLTHLGFGAAGGSIFGLLRRAFPGFPRYALGILFGLSVWAVSYKGWVPALGIMPPPERDRPGRPLVMVAAHVVYGIALAALVERDAD